MEPVKVAKQRLEPQASDSLSLVWAKLVALPPRSEKGILGYHFYHVFRSVVQSPFTFIASVLTTTVSFFLLALIIFLFQNIKSAITIGQSDLSMNVYLSDSANELQIEELQAAISKEKSVQSVQLISKEEALESFKKELGPDALLLEGLGNVNPLPVSFQIQFVYSDDLQNVFESFEDRYSRIPFVERVEYGRSMLGRMAKLLSMIQVWGAAIIAVMLFLAGFVVSNTIRLALYAHREEIEIMKLVGATDRFIRVPYVLEGMFQGFIGSFVAVALLYGVYLVLNTQSSQLIALIFPEVHYLKLSYVCFIILAGMIVGMFGSYFGTKRFSNV